MINTGDTAFMLVSAALVMLMTPGLALFYGGMVRSKNVLGTIMQNFVLLGVISILVGRLRLQPGLWPGRGTPHRQPGLGWLKRRGFRTL